jgi:hypothetical protein
LSDAPGAAGFEEAAALKSGNESGANERGFPGTGESENGDETMAREAVTEVENLLIAAEKEVGFAGFEGAEAGVGVSEFGEAFEDGGEAHGEKGGLRVSKR